MARTALPSGTLTFLFTDLEGSTRLLHEYPNEYGSLLETHRALIRDAVAQFGGIEFGTGGDALFVVFTSAINAVECAARAQRSLQSHAWPVASPLKVRMAVHTGEAEVVDNDYVGLALHVAARLCSAGHGSQVLVSESTRALTQFDVVDLGRHELRDVVEPMQIFQLCGEGMDRDFPPLRTRNARPNNLPVALDRLIGRDLETVEIIASLHNRRLVTLTGSGGSGKTRLALEVATSLVSDFRDGVWLVELGAATTPDQAVALLANTLRVGERGGVALSKTVIDFLSGRETLLVLDNCEHLIDAVASLVHDVVSRCPSVRVLATSRELLGIPGEQAIAVAPLSVGDSSHPGDAMVLFVERVRETKPEFDPGERDLGLIADICERLDGLPLAIELAAARMRSLTVAQLEERLHDRFRLLTGGARTALGRQRTLEAVVAWSYELLSPREQCCFRYLSVFPDSFPLEAAESVAVPAAGDVDVVELLGHLVDKSLVIVVHREAGSRYHLLETIRQYGRDRLVEHGESDGAHARLLAWVMTLTEQLERDMRTPRQDAAIHAVLPERSNARAALEWAIDHHDRIDAVRIASAVPVMITSQRRNLLERLLADTPELPDERRAQVLFTLANLSMEQGDFEGSGQFARQAGALFAALGDRRHQAWARYFEVFAIWGDPYAHDDARQLSDEMVATFRDLDDELGLAYSLWVASLFTTEFEAASEKARESEQLFRRLNAPFGLAHALEGRALIGLRIDGTATSDAGVLAEALTTFADADNFGCTAHCLEAVAAVLATDGDVAEAAVILGAAEHLRSEVGQEHRAWEREGRVRTQQAFDRIDDADRLEQARNEGRSLGFSDAVERAIVSLTRGRRTVVDKAPEQSSVK